MQNLNEALGYLDKMVGGNSCEFNRMMGCKECPSGYPEGIVCKLRVVQGIIRNHLREEHPDKDNGKEVSSDKKQAPILIGS
ncbi:MAG: hypothetical protein M0Q91_18510 [Methanoregula sp.]|jgi:hypothetical protein|nr:hypothetical protein [Methanoregula sp.]